MADAGEPDWEPLLALMAPELVGWFMWMFPITLADGSRLDAYKHCCTRRYLYLDAELRAWAYRHDGRYGLQPSLADALEGVLAPWWEAGDARPDEVALCWEAIDRAGRLDVARRPHEATDGRAAPPRPPAARDALRPLDIFV